MVDSVYRTRSLGVAAEGLPDQYADGEAARVWQLYIGDTRSRTAEYKAWLLGLLRQVDSIMLVEEGFSVTSVDASDKMLKYALKERWNRRHEPAFDKWVIEEANWMTLDKDVPQPPGGGFDAVICLGNSFAHLPDCKGERGCGLDPGPCFELCLFPQTLWVPALLSEQTVFCSTLPWHRYPQGGGGRWEGDWTPGLSADAASLPPS
uniref:Glycine N-methyltransferase n=1 Tax=Neovison vison TaxID=452646 RepID=A0A8C7AXM4_NEOVI